MARVYATSAELTAWLPTGTALPADPTAALRAASEVVEEMLLTAFYATDDDGMPTDTKVIAALADATCAQVQYAMRPGGDVYGNGSGAGAYKSLNIGGLSLAKADAPTTGDGRADGDGRRSGRAWRILQREGLIPEGPVTWVYC